jgi:hypothetical protein
MRVCGVDGAQEAFPQGDSLKLSAAGYILPGLQDGQHVFRTLEQLTSTMHK